MQDNAPGNVLGLITPGGALAAGYAYDAWGQVTMSGEAGLGGWSNPRRFAGREWDAETGLYSNRARYYDPGLRRFLSRDPTGLRDGVNWYAYAGNDPVNNADPSGTKCVDVYYVHWTENDQGERVVDQVSYVGRFGDCGGGGGGGGGGGAPGDDAQPKPPPICSKDATATDYVRDHRDDAREIASQIGVPTTWVLGLAAWETNWGRGTFAKPPYNNHFSIEGGNRVPFAVQVPNLSPTAMSHFGSFLDGGRSFAAQKGRFVAGARTPWEFADRLAKSGYNTLDRRTNGDPTWREKVVLRIEGVRLRMGC